MVTEVTQIKDKFGNSLTDNEVKKKLEKILCGICSITSVESNVEAWFRQRCAQEFLGFRDVKGSWTTNPKIINVYFKGHSDPIGIVV